ncbi:DUF6361 family protein [Palleronia sp. KMU-117]|uniref:DUF6361 family protein n=1 Tax=Palleronia sp. KMU-117 TaxID=3434108 RepID=UPI003D732A07
MSFLAWIDFDQADRDRTRRIMDLFDSEDSRDELGLGSIRDAISDLLFPGTSTIQTRLRYMLFVPWIYRMAGTRPGPVEAKQQYARALEIRLISALERSPSGDQRGIIGSQARERLKRLPSDVYWAGLLTLGIRRFQGSRSAALEAAPDQADLLWAPGLPPPPVGFLEEDAGVGFSLTVDEAGFIRDRLAREAPQSLFALLARQETAPVCAMVWEHPWRGDWPAGIQKLVNHAELFASLMHGASLLYNLMLSERAAVLHGAIGSAWNERAETYSARLSDWRGSLRHAALLDWNLDDLWEQTLQTIHVVKPATRRFVADWRATVVRTGGAIANDPDARALVQDREERLKRLKSRFSNDGALARWGGASGTAPLSFRWPVASSHLTDLVNAG